MIFVGYVKTSIGLIKLTCLNQYLIESTFVDENDDLMDENLNNSTLRKAIDWFNSYFKGKISPVIDFPILMQGTTFQKDVWEIAYQIPYGKTMTYLDIKNQLCANKKYQNMSCQAIGQALKKNPLLIVVPCHRVVGINHKNIGYVAGINKKVFLLNLEFDSINKGD